jgi:hypothetical protein
MRAIGLIAVDGHKASPSGNGLQLDEVGRTPIDR